MMQSHVTSLSQANGEDYHKETFPPQDYQQDHLKETFPNLKSYVMLTR